MSQLTEQRRTPNAWWVGIVAGMASYIDAAAIVASGIALVIYQFTIGITPDQIGVMSAALTFCIAIGAVAGGRAGDRYGRRSVFIVTMTLIVLGSLLTTFGTTFAVLLPGIILVGLGIGADLPVSLATIAESASDKNRGKIIILSNLLWLVGILSSIVIASFLGDLGRLSGQILFGQVGVVALVVLLARLTIPESQSWLAAREERAAGVRTVRAEHASVRDLVTGPYAKTFFALLAFYALTNLAMNTSGQFNTFIAVNLAGSTVEEFNRIALLVMVLGALIGLVAMRVIDTKYRMPFYAVGALFLVASPLVLVFGGFSLTTLSISLLVSTIGGAFSFEGIMKVWTQESFPTMLRSSAQGAIVAVARVAAALLAIGTPALLLSSGRAFYVVLALLSATGLLIAWMAFSKRTGTEFDTEAQLAQGEDDAASVAVGA